jgi:hypothetical protein
MNEVYANEIVGRYIVEGDQRYVRVKPWELARIDKPVG